MGSIRSWPNVWAEEEEEEEEGAEKDKASPDWAGGTVKETTSPEEEGAAGAEKDIASSAGAGGEPGAEKESMVSRGGGELSATAGRGLNRGVVEDTGGRDDCCALKGFSLLKKFRIPSRKVACPRQAETRERTTTERSHSLILHCTLPPSSSSGEN